MPDNQRFDYIVLGAGCAGLSLVLRMLSQPELADKNILLLDKGPKQHNDRTWCFWEPAPSPASRAAGLNFFEHLVHHQWTQLWFRHPKAALPLDVAPFHYKLIRSVDFYRYALNQIGAARGVTVVYDHVTEVDAERGLVKTAAASYVADHIFSSVLLSNPVLQPHQLYLLQHFKGWWIETDDDVFDPDAADLMNYHTSQQHGCTFVYVLPVSKRRALVEYTLFSEVELASADYDEGLKAFISKQLCIRDYRIAEVEAGIIPMTDMSFAQHSGKVTFIGTAGGYTKASTGYTFQFIQRYTHQLAQQLAMGKAPTVHVPKRFAFYDSVLLRVLHERKQAGADVFFGLFKRQKAALLLSFLDNQSSLALELSIMNSTRKSIFVPAALRVLLKRPHATAAQSEN
jgi:lycopene beta-cyclase